MISVNLLPQSESGLRSRAARIRLWLAICTVEAIALGGTGWFVAPGAIARVHASRRVAYAGDRLEQARSALEALTETRDVTLQQAKIAAQVERPRAWSPLWAFLADRTPIEITLDKLSVNVPNAGPEPEKASPDAAQRMPSEASDAPTVRGTLRITGHALDHGALTRFMKVLDDATLFRIVRLGGTRREAYLDGRAVAFTLICEW